jgi:hypothetical protein
VNSAAGAARMRRPERYLKLRGVRRRVSRPPPCAVLPAASLAYTLPAVRRERPYLCATRFFLGGKFRTLP